MLAIIHGCKKMNLRTEACFPGQELQAELTSCWWWLVRDLVVSIWRLDAPRQLRAGPDRAKSNHWNSEERTGTWANEQRKNVVHRLKETATTMTRTRMKLNGSLSNLAERITTKLRSYPEKIIAQFQLKLWEIPISCKNTAFPPKTKSAWNLMHEWNWWISIGRIVHHSSEHQSSQTKMLQSIRTNRSNIRAKKRKTRRTQEHEHTKNDSNFQSPEVTVRLGPHFPTKNSDYIDQFVVHLWTSHSRTTKRRKP